MAEELKFTKELKEAWLTALKSGEYTQGSGALLLETQEGKCHCCLGVLAEIHPNLAIGKRVDIDETFGTYYNTVICNGEEEESYEPFRKLIGHVMSDLADQNDANSDGKYTSVIPMIEELPTVD